MIHIQEVTKTYTVRGKEVAALSGVTLDIGKGEFLAIVGSSGSGKSTLLLTLGGMLSPTTGRVLVEGQSLYDMTVEERAALRRRKIGFVFQTFHLIPYLTVLENVQTPLFLAGRTEREQKETASSLLDRVGLAERLDHKPSELSVGQQQRVALARTLANDPEMILADEPTGNLDPETGQMVQDFLWDMHQRGKTIVMVTHDLQAASRATQHIRLIAGRTVADGVPSDSIAVQPKERAGSPEGEASHA